MLMIVMCQPSLIHCLARVEPKRLHHKKLTWVESEHQVITLETKTNNILTISLNSFISIFLTYQMGIYIVISI